MDRYRLPRIGFFFAVALTFIGVVLRSVCMLTQFDTAVGAFTRGVLPTISTGLYFAAVIGMSVLAFLIPKNSMSKELLAPHRTPFAVVLGFALVAFTVLSIVTSYNELFASGGMMRMILTLSALLAATYFFLSAGRYGRYRDSLIWAGFLPFIWCMCAVATTYSDPSVAINSPIKVSIQMGLLGFMLIMLSELRYRLGKAAPRGAVALTGIGVFCALNAAIPILIGTVIVNHMLYTLCAALLLVAGVYGGYMLYCYTFRPPAAREDIIDDAAESEDNSDSNESEFQA